MTSFSWVEIFARNRRTHTWQQKTVSENCSLMWNTEPICFNSLRYIQKCERIFSGGFFAFWLIFIHFKRSPRYIFNYVGEMCNVDFFLLRWNVILWKYIKLKKKIILERSHWHPPMWFSNIKWMYMTISSGFALNKHGTGCQSSYPMMQ